MTHVLDAFLISNMAVSSLVFLVPLKEDITEITKSPPSYYFGVVASGPTKTSFQLEIFKFPYDR